MRHHVGVQGLVNRVRRRWRQVTLLQGAVRGALAASAVLAVGLFIADWLDRMPFALAGMAASVVLLAVAGLVWGLWPARHAPSDARVARFIEEREPSLDDRLVSAVDLAAGGRTSSSSALAAPMLADADRRASSVDAASIVPAVRLRRAAALALTAMLLLLAVAFAGRETAFRAFDAVSLALFPSRVSLEVTPGSARVPAGTGLTIGARLIGISTPLAAQLLRADLDEADEEADAVWLQTEMTVDSDGGFTVALESIETPFKYRVVAAGITSPVFDVTVARAPRVERIDVEYTYPSALRLEPRVEEDGGDIYAPQGTDVRILVHPDREGASGQMTLADGRSIPLAPGRDNTLVAGLKVVADGSYRVTLSADGLARQGETEYFIRTVEDRPPEVRIVRPARDRTVTRLEEVDIEVEADDDFGLDRLELVYAVRGGAETVVPLSVVRGKTMAAGSLTLYVEDLDVSTGDFISYYARARDQARGKDATEARSDIFFLEVAPFEQQFMLVPTQASLGGGDNALDDLVAAQKEIIVATWKLDTRAEAARGARSGQDIKAVARAEAELKTRVEEASSAFRASMMRDPRRPSTGRGGQASGPRAGQTLSEEDAMTAAAAAMGRAVGALERLNTSDAIAPEMEALNHLLKAQADVTRRQVSRQQAGNGSGGNRQAQDLSSLFDRELQREQATNYETPTSTERRDNPNESELEKIRELARRQDELRRRQQELARERERLSAEELGRQLEALTREQQQLRQRADEMARRMENQERQQQAGSQNPSGSLPQQGRPEQPDQAGRPEPRDGRGASGARPASERGEGGGTSPSDQLRQAADEMRDAANELRQSDPREASESGSRALQRLEQLARQLQAGAPDERRRALGDLQLESRQLAEAQRQIAGALTGSARGDSPDSLRRLAGEEERLAERVERLQQGLQREADTGSATGTERDGRGIGRASDSAAREIERQRLAERMRQSAAQMRGGVAGGRGNAAAAAGAQQEIARALERLADTLAAATTARDSESQRMADQLARARELRQEMDRLTREIERLEQASSNGSDGGGDGSLSRLQQQYREQLRQTRELLKQLQNDDPALASAGAGLTFDGQGMVLSAPGTEAFKQDFSAWEQLNQQVTVALQNVESALAQKLGAKEARDRLASGAEGTAPAAYQEKVDSYFKSLATKKKP
jgi:hypothetical protein